MVLGGDGGEHLNPHRHPGRTRDSVWWHRCVVCVGLITWESLLGAGGPLEDPRQLLECHFLGNVRRDSLVTLQALD